MQNIFGKKKTANEMFEPFNRENLVETSIPRKGSDTGASKLFLGWGVGYSNNIKRYLPNNEILVNI